MTTLHIDLLNLDRLFKGDRSRMAEWIRLYLEEAPTYFDQLTRSMAAGDATALAAAAHELRPQAHYLGCARLMDQLMALEQQALNAGTEACKEHLIIITELAGTIEAELRTLLASPTFDAANR